MEKVYVLFSALKQGETITPVQFEIEQYISDENRLYLAVALTKIETGVKGNTAPDEQKATSLLPISNISISEIFAKINLVDKNFLKYIPNQFLNEEQIQAKNAAIAKDKAKYSNSIFSDRENVSVYDIMGERDRILKENEQFKAEIENLKERVELEKEVTNGTVLNNNSLLAAAAHLRNIANSNMDKVDLAKALMHSANMYKEMATDELKHSSYVHELAVKEIQKISNVYTPPIEMQEKWENAHKEYVEKSAWIRQMFTM